MSIQNTPAITGWRALLRFSLAAALLFCSIPAQAELHMLEQRTLRGGLAIDGDGILSERDQFA